MKIDFELYLYSIFMFFEIVMDTMPFPNVLHYVVIKMSMAVQVCFDNK